MTFVEIIFCFYQSGPYSPNSPIFVLQNVQTERGEKIVWIPAANVSAIRVITSIGLVAVGVSLVTKTQVSAAKVSLFSSTLK